MAIDIVARALAVSGKQNLENYYTKTESDGRYVKSSENFVKAFTIPNGASTGTLTADAKQKLCNPDGHNYYVYDSTSEMILKYSFNEDDEIIQYKALYLVNDKAYDITMQILPSNGSWRRSQTILNGATANPTLTGTEAELTGITIGGTDYKIPVTKEYVDDGFVKKQTGVSDRLYSIDSTGQDNVLGYSQSPANSAITQYTSSGTVRTKAPIDNLDAVNKQYANRYYETLSCYNATLIPANANLDTYVTFGNYYANSAQGVTNLPDGITSSGNTLKLSVGAASDDVAAYQILYVWASNNGEFKGKYIRSTVGEGWNTWERFATNKDKVFSVTIYEAGE